MVHSTTKYIGGHGTSIGGIIVDGGNFDWEKHADRFPMLNQPDPSYHGVIWSQAAKPLGPIAYILKARTTLLRDLGPAISPFNAFMQIQGLETLPLRMRQHCANAIAVSEHLQKHPKVTRVIFPGAMNGEAKRRADAYLKGGYGALVGFELQGGLAAGRKFIDALKMFYHVANIGDARSLAIHPASTTHSQLSAGRAVADRRLGQLCAALDRHRTYRRHRGRPGSGPARLLNRGPARWAEPTGPAFGRPADKLMTRKGSTHPARFSSPGKRL